MQFKYITFKDGHRFLINTHGYIATNWTVDPTDYNSCFAASEVYQNTVTYNFPDAIIGYIKNGEYHGFTGLLEDYDGNTYRIVKTNNGVTWTITTTGGTVRSDSATQDCTLQFVSSFPDPDTGDQTFGISYTYPWTGGSYANVTSGSASGCFSMESSYLDFVDMYSTKQILVAQVVNADGGVFGQFKTTENRSYFGMYVNSGDTSRGTGIVIGSGEGKISIGNSVTDFEEDEDPYNEPDEGTHSGGGNGNHDKSSDPIDFPSLPTLSAVDTGLVTLYNPSVAELRALADYMWGNLFDLNTFKKLFADPMDAILGLSIVPVNVPAGGSQNVTVGNISTGVSMTKASSQYVTVDCGSLNVQEYWGSYLDYEPYTKMELFLPFIGMRQVSSDDLMNTTVAIKYNVDVLSGACTAFVKCGNSVLYSFEGQCSCMVPVNANDWSGLINAAVNAATSVGALVATGGASAALGAEAEGAKAQMIAAKTTSQCITTGGSVVSSAMNAVKPQIQKSGGLSGCAGLLGGKKPYLVITRPKQAVPGYQNKFQGYPSFITTTLASLSGYTEVDSIILQNVSASDTEKAEIVALLQGGVIL